MTRLVEDRTLLEAFRRGDRPALTEVYREYAPGLLTELSRGFPFESSRGRLRFRGFKDALSRDNAIQEVFARAFGQSARLAYDGLRPYRSYLFSIARNLVIDLAREQGREVLGLELGTEPQAEDAGTPGPAEDLEERELASLCAVFVASIELAERDIFDLRFRKQLSIRDVAVRLSLTEHQVKRTEKLLKKRFFVHLKKGGYLEGYRLSRKGIERAAVTLLLFLHSLEGTC